MSESVKFYPKEENLGNNCEYWSLGETAGQCCYPKMGLEGRTTCGGVIDDVCLNIKDGRPPSDFSALLLNGVKISIPDSSLLPPGEVV